MLNRYTLRRWSMFRYTEMTRLYSSWYLRQARTLVQMGPVVECQVRACWHDIHNAARRAHKGPPCSPLERTLSGSSRMPLLTAATTELMRSVWLLPPHAAPHCSLHQQLQAAAAQGQQLELRTL